MIKKQTGHIYHLQFRKRGPSYNDFYDVGVYEETYKVLRWHWEYHKDVIEQILSSKMELLLYMKFDYTSAALGDHAKSMFAEKVSEHLMKRFGFTFEDIQATWNKTKKS